MALSSVVKELFDRIYSEDFEAQKNFIDYICQCVRNMDSGILYKAKAIFIPNNEYLVEMGGVHVLDESNGLYEHGECIWISNIVFPFFDLNGDIVGFGGFNPEIYLRVHETNDWTSNYYRYSSKNIMQKGKYLYMLPGTFEKAYNDGYLCVTDGLFDTLHLEHFGYNSCALSGSSLTIEMLAQLRVIKKIVIMSDNDSAGLKLEERMKKYLHNCVYFHQGVTKDVDAILKTEHKDKFLQALDDCIKSKFLIDSYYTPKL